MVIGEIRDHIQRLGPKEMFRARDLLMYGNRGAVDTVLHRMVDNEEIIRLTRGLFVRNNGFGTLPDATDIAQKKAALLNRAIQTEAVEACSLQGEEPSFVFLTTGRTTSFRLEQTGERVHFVGTMAPARSKLNRGKKKSRR